MDRQVVEKQSRARSTIGVVGAGAAGLSAAWHAARRGHDVVVVDAFGPGGQLTNAGVIESVPGLAEELTGPELVARMLEQLDEHEVRWVTERVVDVRRRLSRFLIATDGGSEIVVDAVVVASGSANRRLGVPGEQVFEHMGVSHCAVCDGPLFRGRPVAVVGGGDAAAEAAAFLAGVCSRVHLVHRGADLTAVDVLRRRLDGLANVERWACTEVRAIVGGDAVEAVEMESDVGQRTSIAVEAVFVAIGTEPEGSPVARLVTLDRFGCVVVNPGLMSSVPGVFAAGAVRAGDSGQLASAIGDGVTAAVSADRWLAGGLEPGVVALPVGQGSGQAPERSEYFDYAAFLDAMVEAGVGDGLPLVPPTPARLDRFAAALGAAPETVLALLPDGRTLLYADLVTPAILAGCRAEYMPVIAAAAESLLSDLDVRRRLLADSASVVVVNGPVRNAIDVNCSDGLFGPGWRSNATIGRAVQLFVRGCLDVGAPVGFGDAGQIAFCFGEDEEKSQWVPLHVERGFDPSESAATVFTVNVYRHVLDRAHADADGVLEYLSLFLRGRASGTRLFGDAVLSLLIVVGEELRRHLAARYSKEALREELFVRVTADDGTPFGPIALGAPDDISIIGAGGLATPALWCFVSTTPPPRTVRVWEHDQSKV